MGNYTFNVEFSPVNESIEVAFGQAGATFAEMQQFKTAITDIVTGDENTDVDLGGTQVPSISKSLETRFALGAPRAITVSGLTLTVPGVSLNGYTTDTQSIDLYADGTFHLGFDLFTKQLISLPRLGHTGWIHVATAYVESGEVSSIDYITPAMPPCRIPNVVKKVTAGEKIKVLILGSSLAENSSVTSWVGQLFHVDASPELYQVPAVESFRNMAVGGAPNILGLAQVSKLRQGTTSGINDDGYLFEMSRKTEYPSGRPEFLNDIDLCVMTCLANGGNNRLDYIEPTVRGLREMGVEVILTTDNAQGNPFTSYSKQDVGLFIDGPVVANIAERFKCALADTAAYVWDAYWRYPGVNIYSDSIHQAAGTPTGRTDTPSGGHEMYTRAIRSCIPLKFDDFETSSSLSYNFNDGLVPSEMYVQGTGTCALSNVNNQLVVTKITDVVNQWGVRIPIPSHNPGDTIRVTGVLTKNGASSITVGTQGGGSGWGSPVVGVSEGAFDVIVTSNRINDGGGTSILFFPPDSSPNGASFSIDDLTITTNSTYDVPASHSIESQGFEWQILPPHQRVSSYLTPGEIGVVLPKFERRILTISPNKGNLVSHRQGANSFSRTLFPSWVAEGEDCLELTTGQEIAAGCVGSMGLYLVIAADSALGDCQLEVYVSASVKKTVTVSQVYNRETVIQLLHPEDVGLSPNGTPNAISTKVKVLSGTIRISAILMPTPAMDIVPFQDVIYMGENWVEGVSDSMNGMGAVDAGHLASYTQENADDRFWWFLGANQNGKMAKIYSDNKLLPDTGTVGTNHFRPYGGIRGKRHTIKCVESFFGTVDAANGYALHIGGAIIMKDR